jgi:hypothetical protein
MRLERLGIEWLDAQTHMIHVPSRAWRAIPGVIELCTHLQQIDQRPAGAQLRQPEIPLRFLDAATEHVAVETRHVFGVRCPNHNMIDLADMNFHVDAPFGSSPVRSADELPV